MSVITQSHGAAISRQLLHTLYFHWTKALEDLLLARGFALIEADGGDFVPDQVVEEIAADFWSWRVRYESPRIPEKVLLDIVGDAVVDGRPQSFIREILAALAEDDIVPVPVVQGGGNVSTR